MGRRRVHDDHTRLALLAAAETIVARDGISALAVRSVAEAVGASTRAVYSVFGSKEALVRGLATRAFELLMQALDAIPLTEDPIADLQSALVLGFRPFAMEHPDLFRLAFVWSPVRPDAAVLDASETALTRLTVRVERARAAGVLPDRSSLELAYELAGVSNGLASIELCGIPGIVADRFWNDSISDVLRGLCAAAHDHHQQEGV